MSSTLKHGFLLTLVAVSVGLTLALVSQSSQAQVDEDEEPDGGFKLDPKDTVAKLLGDRMIQAATFSDTIALDGKTDGSDGGPEPVLNKKTARINFKFPESGRFLNMKPNTDKLKRFKKDIRELRGRATGKIVANDAPTDGDVKSAKGRFPGTVNGRPRRLLWNVKFKGSEPVKSEIRVRPPRGPVKVPGGPR